MTKKTLYDRAEKAINQAFESAKQSAKVVSQKAGETAHLTKLLVEKMTLEHQVSKKFAKLGSRVYEKAVREGKDISAGDDEISNLIEEARRLDLELSRVEAALEAERKQK
ncbi:MAG: hypothetical protein HYZ83_05055 [Candidatus Omnitrophica bacterium]|nr:hypothetical protein [Candidatus Omnitrophota bacterium]